MQSQNLGFGANTMMTTAIEQQSLSSDLTSQFFEIGFDALNDIDLEDLESVIKELAQGLPSDTESPIF